MYKEGKGVEAKLSHSKEDHFIFMYVVYSMVSMI